MKNEGEGEGKSGRNIYDDELTLNRSKPLKSTHPNQSPYNKQYTSNKIIVQ